MGEKDPNGVAAAIVIIVTAVAGVFGIAVDDATVSTVGLGIAGVLDLLAVLLARRKTWAPDTVRQLNPQTVEAKGVLPEVPKAV